MIPPLELGLLLALLLARLGMLARWFFGFAGGYYYFFSDYPKRVLLAWDWLQGSTGLWHRMWLPCNTLITAAILKAWPDTTLSPTIACMVLSTGALALLYAIARNLWGGEKWAGLLSITYLLFNVRFAQLSLSGGASEIYFQFFLLGGMLLFLRYEDAGGTIDLTGACLLLSIANGVRHEAWLFSLWPGFRLVRLIWADSEGKKRAVHGALLLFLWAPAIYWCAHQFSHGFFPMIPLQDIQANLRYGAVKGGVGRSWVILKSYPRELWNESPVFLSLSFLGFLFSLRSPHAKKSIVYGAWVAAVFGAFIFTPLLDIEIPGEYSRLLVVFKLLASVYWGYALLTLIRRSQRLGRARFLVPSLLVASLSLYAAQSLSWWPCMLEMGAEDQFPDIRQTAQAIVRMRRVLKDRVPHLFYELSGVPAMDELWRRDVNEIYMPIRYADPEGVSNLAVLKQVRRPAKIVDVFSLPLIDFQAFCRKNGVGIVLVKDEIKSDDISKSLKLICRMRGGFKAYGFELPDAEADVARSAFQSAATP